MARKFLVVFARGFIPINFNFLEHQLFDNFIELFCNNIFSKVTKYKTYILASNSLSAINRYVLLSAEIFYKLLEIVDLT